MVRCSQVEYLVVPKDEQSDHVNSVSALEKCSLWFVNSIALEGNSVPYGELMKAPKVLANIVELVAGAVYGR
ncbi:ribonuclease 3-like protein 2 [Cucumis melo var. makuwa]|uniref:Ribonuclease 3-like protein 2 n=1 Tax=Cucumis melo var. makuwa TaxID=1194695 RepID=A0A5A7SKH5_CUCMM|nr:ribonuclease 3-like protein 2 [Cucumis melo var. makuwa]TYK21499.1 ribonuclease 3-like protein 2 [Cucumis melo var. makuwa]